MTHHTFRLVIGFCLMGIMQNPAFASPAQAKSIQELIQLSELDNALHTSLEDMQPMLDSEAENILLRVLNKEQLTTTQEYLAMLEVSQLLKDTSSRMMNQPETMQKIQNIYAESLSEEEIQAYLKFLKTPEGRAINQKNLRINAHVFQYINNLSQKTLQDPKQSAQLKSQFLTIIKPLIQPD